MDIKIDDKEKPLKLKSYYDKIEHKIKALEKPVITEKMVFVRSKPLVVNKKKPVKKR
tara:strand:+ start:3820 stop:3990 length:171 start_codon:yes stop_codon:yes gene_type:complete